VKHTIVLQRRLCAAIGWFHSRRLLNERMSLSQSLPVYEEKKVRMASFMEMATGQNKDRQSLTNTI